MCACAVKEKQGSFSPNGNTVDGTELGNRARLFGFILPHVKVRESPAEPKQSCPSVFVLRLFLPAKLVGG